MSDLPAGVPVNGADLYSPDVAVIGCTENKVGRRSIGGVKDPVMRLEGASA